MVIKINKFVKFLLNQKYVSKIGGKKFLINKKLNFSLIFFLLSVKNFYSRKFKDLSSSKLVE